MDARTRRRTTGFVLIELLLVVVIIGLLIGGYYGLRSGPGGNAPKSTPAQVIDKSKTVECAANLRSLRQMIQLYVIDHDQYPSSFNPSEQGSIGRCPLGGQTYVYDPQSGEIHCTTPGHESL